MESRPLEDLGREEISEEGYILLLLLLLIIYIYIYIYMYRVPQLAVR